MITYEVEVIRREMNKYRGKLKQYLNNGGNRFSGILFKTQLTLLQQNLIGIIFVLIFIGFQLALFVFLDNTNNNLLSYLVSLILAPLIG